MRPDAFNRPPVAILVDRSRDSLSGQTLLELRPERIFLPTDCRRRLTTPLLRGYDLLALCGLSPERHSPGELRAVRDFVRAGGTLILAANAGRFEQATGLGTERLGANAVAGLFGCAFLSAHTLPQDLNGRRGYPRADLVLTAAGRRLGLELDECRIGPSGPLSLPPGATVLVRHARGRPVIAALRFGRGRVLLSGDLEMWNDRIASWAAATLVAAYAPERRRTGTRPPLLLDVPRSSLRRGHIILRFPRGKEVQARATLALAHRVWAEAAKFVPPDKEFRTWTIHLERGCGFQISYPWFWPETNLHTLVGDRLSGEALAASLAYDLIERLLTYRLNWELYLLRRSMISYLHVRVLEGLGSAGYAMNLREARSAGPDVDLGCFYAWSPEPASYFRLWEKLHIRFGPALLRRLLAKIPRKEPFKHIPRLVYGEFDRAAYFLSLAAGPGVYRYLEENGHTLRRIPLAKPGSPALKKAIRQDLFRILDDPEEPASLRADCLSSLADGLAQEKISLARCAGIVTSGARAKGGRLHALPALARLILARDPRGLWAGRLLLTSRDPGLAASLALLLTQEAPDRKSRDALCRLAPRCDLRFRAAAGYALELAGDKRGHRFAFLRLPGCTVLTVAEGMYKIFLMVDGHAVANVFAHPLFWRAPEGGAFSTYYVEWVHTSPAWRRRGLADLALSLGLDHHLDRDCATTSLHTETTNVAHTLYRRYGLIDCGRSMAMKKALRPESMTAPPHGIRIRPGRPSDLAPVTELLREAYAGRAGADQAPTPWPPEGPSFLAWEKRKLVGFVSAGQSGKKVQLDHLGLLGLKTSQGGDDPVRRERVGLALLARLHHVLRADGEKELGAWHVPRALGDRDIGILQRAGYADEPTFLVELHRINNLSRFLQETRAILQDRLDRNRSLRGWTGVVALEGGRLEARVEIVQGKISVPSEPPSGGGSRAPGARAKGSPSGDPAIVIRGTEEAVERMALGISTPFEEHLQVQCEILPTFTLTTREILETLFPKTHRA